MKRGPFRAIALVGPRAAGKTTLSAALAGALEWTWCDTDLALGTRVGMSAGEFLQKHGEAEFRRIEAEVAVEVVRRASSQVVATGGGAVLSAAVRKELQVRDLLTVFLRADPGVLARRLCESSLPRPPLTPLPLAEEVAQLLAERMVHYRAVADVEVDTGSNTIEVATGTILAAVRAAAD